MHHFGCGATGANRNRRSSAAILASRPVTMVENGRHRLPNPGLLNIRKSMMPYFVAIAPACDTPARSVVAGCPSLRSGYPAADGRGDEPSSAFIETSFRFLGRYSQLPMLPPRLSHCTAHGPSGRRSAVAPVTAVRTVWSLVGDSVEIGFLGRGVPLGRRKRRGFVSAYFEHRCATNAGHRAAPALLG